LSVEIVAQFKGSVLAGHGLKHTVALPLLPWGLDTPVPVGQAGHALLSFQYPALQVEHIWLLFE
jgi:hypothetical protein